MFMLTHVTTVVHKTNVHCVMQVYKHGKHVLTMLPRFTNGKLPNCKQVSSLLKTGSLVI